MVLRGRTLPSLDPGAMLVFAALARGGGIRGGAALLGVPRSTVSRRLVELEEQAGSPLAIRTARRFVLTELGTALLERARELEALLERSAELVSGATGEPSGLLRIAAAPVIGEEVLPEIIDGLMRLHPRVTIDVRMSVDYVDLRRGTVDVALRAWALDDAADLFAVRLGMSTTGCWASPSYAKVHGLPKVPSDLSAHECLLVGSAPRPTWTFRVGQRDESVSVAGRIRVDNFRVARDLAARGTGIARMARMFAEPLLQTGALVPVLPRFWPSTPVHAVHAGPNPPTPKVRAFIELARAAIARALAPLPPLVAKRPRGRRDRVKST